MTDSATTLQADPEILEKLDNLASSLDRPRNELLNEALKAYLDDQAWQIAEIEAGLADLDRGAVTAHDDVRAEMAAYVKSKGK